MRATSPRFFLVFLTVVNVAMLSGCAANNTLDIMRGDVNGVRSSYNSQNVNGDPDGAPPLFMAITFKKIEIAKVLILEKGANVNIETKGGQTPLILAASTSYNEMARLLIENGANVNFATRNDGGTPLIFASLLGNTQLAKILIAKGANINAETNDGDTPLSIAGTNEMIKLLTDKGARFPARNKAGRTLKEQRESFAERRRQASQQAR